MNNSNHNVYDVEFIGNTLVAGTDNGLYYSTNQAGSFTGCPNYVGGTISHFLLANNVLYVAFGASGGVAKTTDGINWSNFNNCSFSGAYNLVTNGNLFYANSTTGLRYTTLSSASWSNSFADSAYIGTIYQAAYSPRLAITDSLLITYIFGRVKKMSLNHLGVFTDISENLPRFHNPADTITRNYISQYFVFDNKIWIAANNYGAFTKPISDLITDVPKKPNQENCNFLTIYPNPANNELTITLPNNKKLSANKIVLCNSTGTEQNCPIQTNVINIHHLSKGVYFIKVCDDEGNYYNASFIKN